MKNRELQSYLDAFDPELEVKVRAATNVPNDLEDASAEDVMIADGDVLEITNEKSFLITYGNELHIIADKVWED